MSKDKHEIIDPNDIVLYAIGKSYEVFYGKMSDSYFEFNPTDRELSSMFNFVDLINEKYGIQGIGYDFIYNYFIFQLDYWSGLDTKFGNKIPLTWFIGKKAFDRWINRIELDLWHAHRTAKNYNIHIGLITPKDEVRSADSMNHHEEYEKSRFYGKDEGFINCIESTTMFNHMSLLCIDCEWKTDCKVVLKQEFPKIYILRGYLKEEKLK